MITIYISSTYEDLKDYRTAVCAALRSVRHYRIIAMEDYVATDQRPVDKCLDDVAKSDIYVGIFGFRYGYIPPVAHNNPEGLSITELEYQHAKKLSIPDLVFVSDLNADIPREFDDSRTGEGDNGTRINNLRNYLTAERMAGIDFISPYQLASKVQAAIAEKEEELRRSGRIRTDAPELPAAITWDIRKDGSPFPGLKQFTKKFAPVFFGRDSEAREVLDRFYNAEGRFIIISGNSGSGKSSLVDAGILPKLKENGLPGGNSCLCVRMVPSQGFNFFDALKGVLQSYAVQGGRDPQQMAEELIGGPERFSREIQAIITDGIDRNELVLFIDQMEELFTVRGKGGDDESAAAFLSSLYHAVHHIPLRVIATIRGDFLHYCHQHPEMLTVLRGPGHYPLGPLPQYLLDDVIVKPARCAGLTISPTLVDRIIRETGSDPGNLPVLAFVLERLFIEREETVLSERAYDACGGVQGAINEHAKAVELQLKKELGDQALERLPDLFQYLLVANIEGQPTRRRIMKAMLPSDLHSIVELLAAKRLLTIEDERGDSVVSVAHEKLFEAWPALRQWTETNIEDLKIVRQAEIAAQLWIENSYDFNYLWPEHRLVKLEKIVAHVACDEIVRQFAGPQMRLISTLGNDQLSHQDRLKIQSYLINLGDPRPGVSLTSTRVPDIEWVPIPGCSLSHPDFVIQSFSIARYPVTNAQFRSFEDAGDGYQDKRWWEGILRVPADPPRWTADSRPRENISWFEAVAFCRWLTEKNREQGLLGEKEIIRLPTEWEWEQAATKGKPENSYPWGSNWDGRQCNSEESGLECTTIVGLYPNGTWEQGPMDMAGNIWEWCLNTYASHWTDSVVIDSTSERRAIKGGSWKNDKDRVSCFFRGMFAPDYNGKNGILGFRLALASI